MNDTLDKKSDHRRRPRRGAQPKLQRDKDFAADFDGGMTTSALSRKYGLKESTVRMMVVRFRRDGLIHRPSEPRRSAHADRDAEIVSLYEEGGLTEREIAAQYEMTPINVSSIIRSARIRKVVGSDAPIFLAVPQRVAESLADRKIDDEARDALVEAAKRMLGRY